MIDNVFDSKYYRYVPEAIRNEWRTISNNYEARYWEKMHEVNDIYIQIRIDLYNEELRRLISLQKKVINFKDNVIPKIKSIYNNETGYVIKTKESLTKSCQQILKFLQEKIDKLNKIMNKKKIPLVEKFTKINNNGFLIILIIIVIMFFIYYILRTRGR